MSEIAAQDEIFCTACRDGKAGALDLTMAFQPIVDVAAGRLFAYEALVRGPAEEDAASMLAKVTDENRYIFDQTCRVRAIETACRAGILKTDALLSINIMPNAVRSPLTCIQSTLRAAEAHKLPLDRLIFEFVEDEEMADPSHIQGIVDMYRRLGLATAIDDIGAGYSGLGLLAHLVPNLVKIAMDLVSGVDHDPRRRAIIEHIVSLGHALGFRVIGEGVERREEMEALSDLGVELMQGFLFARPGFESLPEPWLPH